jgi:ABC-type sugar transport system permease subunit
LDLFAFFSIIPLIYVISTSLTESTLAQPFKDFVWFSNYKQAVLDENFKRSLTNTFVFAFVVTTLETLLGFLLAYAVRGIRGLSTILKASLCFPCSPHQWLYL